jgi:signal transduction histidine kinase
VTDSLGVTTKFQLLTRLLDQPSRDPKPLEKALAELVEVFGLRAAGIRWPAVGTPHIEMQVGQDDRRVSSEWNDAIGSKVGTARASSEVIVERSSADRLIVPLLPEGRQSGAFWATRHAASPWPESDTAALTLAAQIIVRSPDFVHRMGPTLDQMRVSQRINDAAVVAGKIAHDFDNIFTGVVGFADMVLPMLQPGSIPHQYIAEVSSAGNRGIQFTQQLHTLSRCGHAKPMPSTLSMTVAKEEARLRRATPNFIRFQTSVSADLPPVAIEAGTLQLILGNILDNAVEASPQRGIVKLEASLTELSEFEARDYLGQVSAGSYVLVRIRDEGPGLREEQRRRLFVEPFYTTKVRHRGLGLSIVYRVMSAHRGGVRVESSLDRGTLVSIVLPLAARIPESSATGAEVLRIQGGKS